MSRSMDAGLTLTAQANARPIPSTMSSTQKVPLNKEDRTSISGRGLYDNAMAGDKLAFFLSGLDHPLRDTILDRAASRRILDLSHYEYLYS